MLTLFHFVILSNKTSHKTSWTILIYCDFLWTFILKITQHSFFLKKADCQLFLSSWYWKKKKRKDQPKASCIEIMLSVQCVLKTKPYTRISLGTSGKTTWRLCKVAHQYRRPLILSSCTYLILWLCSLQRGFSWKSVRHTFILFRVNLLSFWWKKISTWNSSTATIWGFILLIKIQAIVCIGTL